MPKIIYSRIRSQRRFGLDWPRIIGWILMPVVCWSLVFGFYYLIIAL